MCIGMCISIPPSIPHFGPNFGTTRTMYYLNTPWVPLPRLSQLIRLTFLAFVTCITSYLTIRLGTSPRPQATFIFLVVVSCVVELWNDSSCQFTINFLYSIVWKNTHPPTLHHSQIFLIQSLASPCVDELYMFVEFIPVSDNSC